MNFNSQNAEDCNDRSIIKVGKFKAPHRILAKLGAIALKPNSAISYYNYGILKEDCLNNSHGALADFYKAIALNPKLIRVYNDRCIMKVNKLLTEMGEKSDSDISQTISLDLAWRQLIGLPESIGQRLSHLDSLYLNGNQLTSLPESIGRLANLQNLNLSCNRLTSLPESIGRLTNLQWLHLNDNQLTSLPESIFQRKGFANGRLTNLHTLHLDGNQLTSLPESIGRLTNLQNLNLSRNQLTILPESIGQLTNLQSLDLSNNPIADLSPLQKLNKTDLSVRYAGINLPHRYWTKLSEWQPKWLLDEINTEIRRTLIQNVGYETICAEVGAKEIDTWREYTLIKIDNFQPIYQGNLTLSAREAMALLKMTCPSTGHVHMLRVPPEMESAQEAITWVNHGIHPNDIAIQT